MRTKYKHLSTFIVGALFLSSYIHGIELDKISFKGDLRLREQWETSGFGQDRYRPRYRLRLGADHQLSNQLSVTYEVATGTGDSRSNNQSASLSQPDIRLNKAHLTYTAYEGLSFLGGKFKNPISNISEWVMDSDINPEGLGVIFEGQNKLKGFSVNSYYSVITEDQNKGNGNINLWAIQTGYKASILGLEFKGILGYSTLSNINLLSTSASNEVSGNNYVSNFNPINIGLSVKKKQIPFVKNVELQAEYLINTAAKDGKVNASDKNSAHLLGFVLGDDQLNKLGTWKVQFGYRFIQQDAFFDQFPDSDFYSGKTNVSGTKSSLGFGLSENTFASLTYVTTQQLITKIDQSLAQIDFNLKF